MTNKLSRWWSNTCLAVLGISVGLAVGGCAVSSDEPVIGGPAAPVVEAASTSELAGAASLQTVFQCFDPNDTPIGTPKSTLDGCRAVCAAPNVCVRCIFQDNALECL